MNATSLIPLDTILPEKCAFIIGFSCTVRTKMKSLSSSLADGVLADAILITPRPPILPTNTRKGRGKVQNLVTQKTFSNKMLGRAQDPRANGAWLSKNEA